MSFAALKQEVVPIFQKYGVSRASLFGSVIRGEDENESDIDFLVELPKKVTGLDYFGLKMELQECLEKKLKRKVDLVEYDLIKPSLKRYILSEQKPIYP